MVVSLKDRLLKLLNKIHKKQLKMKQLDQEVYVLIRKAEILEKRIEQNEKVKES